MKTLAYLLYALAVGHVAEVLAQGSCADPSQAVPVYRDFDIPIGDHFYTTNITEYNAANTNGYFAEGARFYVFATAVADTSQFIRLYSGVGSDHFYTTNSTEAALAVSGAAYTVENLTPMYIYTTQLCGSVPLYRSFNPTVTDHFYTTSESEQNQEQGYNFELIAGYVLPLPASSSSSAAGGAAGTGSASPPVKTNAAQLRLPGGVWPYIYSLHLLTLAGAVL
ncbi:hypothetical protein K438DRAFT_1834324 [Mycena galopus ATCC 62051]|nr:hypothetical protein K438DRAFT_1834324 [Mycena galopus ATCC 62051]